MHDARTTAACVAAVRQVVNKQYTGSLICSEEAHDVTLRCSEFHNLEVCFTADIMIRPPLQGEFLPLAALNNLSIDHALVKVLTHVKMCTQTIETQERSLPNAMNKPIERIFLSPDQRRIKSFDYQQNIPSLTEQ